MTYGNRGMRLALLKRMGTVLAFAVAGVAIYGLTMRMQSDEADTVTGTLTAMGAGGGGHSGALSAVVQVSGAALAERAEQQVLTVRYDDGTGRVERQVSMGDLLTLPRAGFATHTIWTEGPQTFEGVWLADLVTHLGIGEGVLELCALNEYLVEYPVADIADSRALVAFLNNGVPMSPRERGPLWVVYPYDSDPALQTEPTYVASIWQLNKMVALP